MGTQLEIFENPRFNGSDYSPKFDDVRLKGQIKKIYALMIDGKWRTLSEIEQLTNYGQASISAQLRQELDKQYKCSLQGDYKNKDCS